MRRTGSGKFLDDTVLIRRIIERYKAGDLVTDIIRNFRTNHTSLKRLLIRAGVQLRPKGWHPPYKRRPKGTPLAFKIDVDGERINLGRSYKDLLVIAAQRGSRAARAHLGGTANI